jgi:dihydrodipicolinate synthase/N-acetylneuraminate lyase
MLAAVSRASVAATLELAELAAALQYDAVLISNPHRIGGQKERLTYFRAVADRSPVPVVLYSTRESPIDLEAVVELSHHSNILSLIGETESAAQVEKLKELAAGFERDVTVTHIFTAVTSRMATQDRKELIAPEALAAGGSTITVSKTKPTAPPFKVRNKKVGFQILTANDSAILENLQAGAIGAMPACAAFAPQAVHEIFAAWKDGDVELAREKQQRMGPAIDLQVKLGSSATRYAADLNGYFGGLPRLPRLPLSGSEKQAVEAVMSDIRN